MDATHKKRLAAAVSGVYRYLRGEEEQQLAVAAVQQRVPTPAAGAVSLWSSSGRLAMMDMRRLLQMRLSR